MAGTRRSARVKHESAGQEQPDTAVSNDGGLQLGGYAEEKEEEEEEEEKDEPLSGDNDNILISLGNDEEEEDEVDEPLSFLAGKDTSNDILLMEDEDQEETDEPLPEGKNEDDSGSGVSRRRSGSSRHEVAACSTEFSEALLAISTDHWDISSWLILIEEVEQGRGGTMTIPEAYNKILDRFPRAAKFWKNLADHYFRDGKNDLALDVYKKSTANCRNVSLWTDFLRLRTAAVEEALKTGVQSVEYATARSLCDEAFVDAIENVGSGVDALPLWRLWIGYLKGWPETGVLDSAKKLAALREAYQRAVCVAMEHVEEMWSEYEDFERVNGDQSSVDMFLTEFNRRHLHAKTVLRERRRLTANIIFDRLATPASNSSQELQQLELWNNWITYEMSSPDYMSAASFAPLMRMIFGQCLCCFRYHPELWMSLARFEQQQLLRQGPRLEDDSAGMGSRGADGINGAVSGGDKQEGVPTKADVDMGAVTTAATAAARKVYVEAIDANPTSALLRCALVELEEEAGEHEAAKEVLRVTFEQIPTGFTFSLYQRYLRRTVGIDAARRLFSETLPMRRSDPQLGLSLFLAHAQLEMEINCAPQVALKALQLARKNYPACGKDIRYLRCAASVLRRIGDVQLLRWIFQSALHSAYEDGRTNATSNCKYGAGGAANGSARALGSTAGAGSIDEVLGGGRGSGGGRAGRLFGRRLGSTHSAAATALANNIETLRTEMEIWETYLWAETAMGRSDSRRLNSLRASRDRTRTALEEAERIRLGLRSGGAGNRGSDAARKSSELAQDVRATARELAERYLPVSVGASSSASLSAISSIAGTAGDVTGELPEVDVDLLERSLEQSDDADSLDKDASALGGRGPDDRWGADGARGRGGGRDGVRNSGRGGRDRDAASSSANMSTEFHLSMAGLPAILRDLLAKLPFHVGPLPDVDAFVRHMKSAVLPPRPAEEDSKAAADLEAKTAAAAAQVAALAASSAGAAGAGQDGQEGLEGMGSNPTWLKAVENDEEDDENDQGEDGTGGSAMAVEGQGQQAGTGRGGRKVGRGTKRGVSALAGKKGKANSASVSAEGDVFRQRQKSRLNQ